MTSRFETLWQHLPKSIDGAIIQSDVNRRYFTGMPSSAGTLVIFREAAYLIIDFRYIEKARATVTSCEVIEQNHLYSQMEELIREHGAKTMAIESMELHVSEYHALQNALRAVTTLDDSDTLSRAIYDCRTIKSDEELEKIEAAQAIAEKAFEDILNYIAPGRTEWDIMMRLNQTMLEEGSDGESFPTIALTGSATSMPHGVPSRNRIVEKGDFVLMDYGATVDGYHSDMTRTVCVGQPSDKMRTVYETVLKAQTTAIQAAAPGISGRTLDGVARSIIENAGYGETFGHSLGHGVGLEIHEYPNAAPSVQTLLAPGNVVTVEPGIYLAGEFGVRIEDFVAITQTGCRNLTKAPKQLITL